jgi:hypothetical protein
MVGQWMIAEVSMKQSALRPSTTHFKHRQHTHSMRNILAQLVHTITVTLKKA